MPGYPLPMRALLTLTITSLLLVAGGAEAQGRVSIENLTIDGDPPPDEYREVLAAGLRPSLLTISSCYAATLAADPTVQGDYMLRMWVSAREVIRITPESDLGNDTLELCTRQAIYAFHLPPEVPAGGAWVRMTIRFVGPPPGTMATPPPPAATPPATTPPTSSITPPTAPVTSELLTLLPAGAPTVRIDSISGALERGRFEGAMPVPALAACADGTAGSLPVRITVTAAGRVRARAGRGMSSTVRNCVVEALRAVAAPTSSGSTSVRVTVTFTARTP